MVLLYNTFPSSDNMDIVRAYLKMKECVAADILDLTHLRQPGHDQSVQLFVTACNEAHQHLNNLFTGAGSQTYPHL